MYVPLSATHKKLTENKLEFEKLADIENVEKYILEWLNEKTPNQHLAILGK